MNILICGAGFISAELLKRFSETWRVTLVEKDETLLGRFSNRYTSIVQVLAGDASSPVVLEEARLADQEYVLALTRDDRVNLAVATFAREAGIKNIISLLYLQEYLPRFQALDVATVNVTQAVAGTIYHYLQDPRITVTTVAQGRAELLELEVGGNPKLVGRSMSQVHHPDWRIVGLIRQEKMLPYDTETILQKGDRVLILGQLDVFKDVCSLIECGEPHFPLLYGNSLVLVLPDEQPAAHRIMLQESLHLIKNTKLQHMTVFCRDDTSAQEVHQAQGPQGLTIDVQQTTTHSLDAIKDFGRHNNLGIIVFSLLERTFVDVLAKPVHIALAHALPCPMLVAKGTHPYESILVPFNGSAITREALEAAIDLSIQTEASVTAAIIREPEFLHGTEDESQWVADLLEQVRQLAHIYKINIEEVVKTGNPVAEVCALARNFNLMVIGSTNEAKEFLTPHVGELLVRKSPCSVLIIAQ